MKSMIYALNVVMNVASFAANKWNNDNGYQGMGRPTNKYNSD